MSLHRCLLASAAFSVFTLAATCAFAQSGPSAEPQNTVSELVVTGLKDQGLQAPVDGGALGTASVLDTPFSVTVISSEEISLRQPQTIGQVFINDPGVFSFSSAGTVNWWGLQIRGLPVRNYYVDDTPMVLYWGGDYPLESVESVQALKGATGFMYGFGAPGGAILYKTKRPTAAPTLSTEAEFRGRSVFSAHVDAGGPIDAYEQIGYRLNLAGSTGEEYNGGDISRGLASLAVDYKVAPNVTLRVNATYEDYDLQGEPFHIYLNSGIGTLPAFPDGWDNLNVDNSYYRYHMLAGGAVLDWRINDNWRADLQYGHTRKRHRSNKDFIDLYDTNGDYDGYVYHFGELDEARFLQAKVVGGFDTGPLQHELVLGASTQDFRSQFGFGGYGGPGLEFSGNIFAPQPFLNPTPVADGIAGGSIGLEQQDAVFVSDTVKFGEHWQALLGLRRTHYDQEGSYSTNRVSPTVALIYKPSANATLYGSYVDSLEPGQVVQAPFLNAGDILPATVSKQYEVGAKLDSDRTSLTVAAFRVERANTIVLGTPPNETLAQAGLSLYNGLEAIGRYRVTRDLTLGLGAVYLDASIEDTDIAGIPGNRPAESSEWQLVANADYNVPAIEGLSVYGTVRYFGDAPTDDFNTLLIPAYTLVSAGAAYRTEISGRPVTFTANVNNLFNEKYWGLQNFGETINGSVGVKVGW